MAMIGTDRSSATALASPITEPPPQATRQSTSSLPASSRAAEAVSTGTCWRMSVKIPAHGWPRRSRRRTARSLLPTTRTLAAVRRSTSPARRSAAPRPNTIRLGRTSYSNGTGPAVIDPPPRAWRLADLLAHNQPRSCPIERPRGGTCQAPRRRPTSSQAEAVAGQIAADREAGGLVQALRGGVAGIDAEQRDAGAARRQLVQALPQQRAAQADATRRRRDAEVLDPVAERPPRALEPAVAQPDHLRAARRQQAQRRVAGQVGQHPGDRRPGGARVALEVGEGAVAGGDDRVDQPVPPLAPLQAGPRGPAGRRDRPRVVEHHHLHQPVPPETGGCEQRDRVARVRVAEDLTHPQCPGPPERPCEQGRADALAAMVRLDVALEICLGPVGAEHREARDQPHPAGPHEL